MMIITKTPYRISFFGGGTDFPFWIRENGGKVVSTTIDKYCYITCRKLPPFFEHKSRFVYSIIESVKNIDEVKHPAIKGVLKWLKIDEGLEIHHDGDLPARSGLGSSSSFSVGLIHALYKLYEISFSRKQLAKDAIYVEQEVIGDIGGMQDQIAVVHGGFNEIIFHNDLTFDVKNIDITTDKLIQLNKHLLLFFTGIQRNASSIESEKISNLSQNYNTIKEMASYVEVFLNLLKTEQLDIVSVGKLLNENWNLKKSLSGNVSNNYIDEIYQTALKNGALGGKVLGAGGGGFIIFLAPPIHHKKIILNLKKLVNVPFRFETKGSVTMFNDV